MINRDRLSPKDGSKTYRLEIEGGATEIVEGWGRVVQRRTQLLCLGYKVTVKEHDAPAEPLRPRREATDADGPGFDV